MMVTTLAKDPGDKLEDWDGWKLYEHYLVSNSGLAIPLKEVSEFRLHHDTTLTTDTSTMVLEAFGFAILVAAMKVLAPIAAILITLGLLAAAYDLGGDGLFIIICLTIIFGLTILSGYLDPRSSSNQHKQKVKLVHQQAEYFLTFGNPFLANLAIKRFNEVQQRDRLWFTATNRGTR